ncbi:hypothetical protein SISSUDRAFT_1067829 [Sistotremastrum suecicum HHB10207 ss-3]|uniref:DUF6570 domain-containing protein n=1 Tax=Sistotremastrum suecicum HHB10207 ss-3 TaxID=1314776 RepID=A0A165WN06_9AGAM|nr:hypothetical protein SISSUDRAFT_1067829 [Sistotremastrum suecicum HHB10207 ss-3]
MSPLYNAPNALSIEKRDAERRLKQIKKPVAADRASYTIHTPPSTVGEKFWTVKEVVTKCNRCQRSPVKGRKYSANNDMDPGKVVPDCLMDLTDIEEQLISLTRPVIHNYPPQHSNNPPKAQPRRPRDLDIVIIRQTAVDLTRHIDFKVRKMPIRDALHYLCANNPQYQNVEIDEDLIANLPDNGFIAEDLVLLETESTHQAEVVPAPGPSQSAEDATDEHEKQADVLGGVLDLADAQRSLLLSTTCYKDALK